MEITRVRTAKVSVPVPRRAETIGGPEHCENVLIWVEGAEGVDGQSCIWLMGPPNLDAYQAAVHALEGLVIGKDTDSLEEIHDTLWGSLRHQFGTKGIGVTAASALESATWDLLGKERGESVSSMLGRQRDRVPVYAGASLWFSASIPELRAEAEAWLADGYQAMKMRAGVHGVEEDARRITALRETVGDDVDLMVDCLQMLSFDDALALGRAVEDLSLTWLEDPIDSRDLTGHARLAEELNTPIATGEHEYGVHGFETLFDLAKPDVALIDLARVGGVRDFTTVAEIAASRDIPIVSHCNPEQCLQVMAAAPEAMYVDQLTWWEPLYAEHIDFDDGHYLVPDRPGFGFTFVDDVVERFGV